MNHNLHRIMIQPAHVIQLAATIPETPQAAVQAIAGGTVGGKNAAALAASLSPLPRTIHALWHEYEFVIGRRKPACK
jgi:hypothetical protein